MPNYRKEGERKMADVPASDILTFRLAGEEGWYMASCPELDVSGGGVSPEAAKANLFACAKVAAKHIASLNGVAPPDKKRFASLVLEHRQDLDSVFREA